MISLTIKAVITVAHITSLVEPTPLMLFISQVIVSIQVFIVFARPESTVLMFLPSNPCDIQHLTHPSDTQYST